MALYTTTKVELLKNRKVSHSFTHKRLADVAAAIDNIQLTDAEMSIGRLEHRLDYKYEYSASGVRTVSLWLRQQAFMPAWHKLRDAGEKEKAEWNRFWMALWEHELGHYNINKRRALELHKAMNAAQDAVLDSLFQQGLGSITRANELYDSQTKHGVIQRTRFGTTVIEVDSQSFNNSTPVKDAARATQANIRKINRAGK